MVWKFYKTISAFNIFQIFKPSLFFYGITTFINKRKKKERIQITRAYKKTRQQKRVTPPQRTWKWTRDQTSPGPLLSRACLSKALFAYDCMPKHPQTTPSLSFVLSLVYCFPFYVIDLEYDISHFSYASLSKLKMF